MVTPSLFGGVALLIVVVSFHWPRVPICSRLARSNHHELEGRPTDPSATSSGTTRSRCRELGNGQIHAMGGAGGQWGRAVDCITVSRSGGGALGFSIRVLLFSEFWYPLCVTRFCDTMILFFHGCQVLYVLGYLFCDDTWILIPWCDDLILGCLNRSWGDGKLQANALSQLFFFS